MCSGNSNPLLPNMIILQDEEYINEGSSVMGYAVKETIKETLNQFDKEDNTMVKDTKKRVVDAEVMNDETTKEDIMSTVKEKLTHAATATKEKATEAYHWMKEHPTQTAWIAAGLYFISLLAHKVRCKGKAEDNK